MYTQHAVQRAMQRTGRNEKSARDFIAKAIDYGTLIQDLPPYQRECIRAKVDDTKTVVVYGGYIFVIGDNGDAVTMFETPEWFASPRKQRRPKVRSNEPVRSIKKWQKMRGIR